MWAAPNSVYVISTRRHFFHGLSIYFFSVILEGCWSLVDQNDLKSHWSNPTWVQIPVLLRITCMFYILLAIYLRTICVYIYVCNLIKAKHSRDALCFPDLDLEQVKNAVVKSLELSIEVDPFMVKAWDEQIFISEYSWQFTSSTGSTNCQCIQRWWTSGYSQ